MCAESHYIEMLTSPFSRVLPLLVLSVIAAIALPFRHGNESRKRPGQRLDKRFRLLRGVAIAPVFFSPSVTGLEMQTVPSET